MLTGSKKKEQPGDQNSGDQERKQAAMMTRRAADRTNTNLCCQLTRPTTTTIQEKDVLLYLTDLTSLIRTLCIIFSQATFPSFLFIYKFYGNLDHTAERKFLWLGGCAATQSDFHLLVTIYF
jgi:hypothetical protein